MWFFWILLIGICVLFVYLYWIGSHRSWWGIMIALLSMLAFSPIYIPYGTVGTLIFGLPVWFILWLGIGHLLLGLAVALYFWKVAVNTDAEEEKILKAFQEQSIK